MALEYDQYIDQGTTFSSVITVNGADLSSAIITAQMRKSFTSDEYTEFVIVPIDLVNGKFLITLDSYATSYIKSGRYVYDVIYRIEDKVVRIMQGILTINPMVSS